MKSQEYQLIKLRAILLNESNLNAERVAAQRQIMKILNLREDNNLNLQGGKTNGN